MAISAKIRRISARLIPADQSRVISSNVIFALPPSGHREWAVVV